MIAIKVVINNQQAMTESTLAIGEFANFISRTSLTIAKTIKRDLLSNLNLEETQS